MIRGHSTVIPDPATQIWNTLRRVLPQGTPLPEDTWQRRHRAIVVLLWAHVVGLIIFGLAMGQEPQHAIAEGSIIAITAALATLYKRGRRVRAVVASLGLLISSAVLVHQSGGYIEMHFHFFVMLAVITLYQDWVPFLAALTWVLLEHGLGGALFPVSVYNHPDAWENPWKWAAIHALFVAGASVAAVTNWRLNEAARAQTALILDAVAEGIVGLDRKGHVTFVNPAAVSMTGYSASELTNETVRRLFRSREPGINDRVGQLFQADGSINPDTHHWGQVVIRRRDGTSFPARCEITPIFEAGVEIGAVLTFRDVSARVQAQADLKESNKQLEATIRELRQTQQQVVQQERLRALGQMASGIAHDFNNALATVQGFTELLLLQPGALDDRQKVRQYLELISTSANDAASVVRRLRSFYRPQTESEVFRPVDMSQVVAEVLSLTQFRWKDQALAKGARITIETDLPSAPPVMGDPSELREALTNLIFNAVDAMPAGGAIQISTKPDGDHLLISVADTGTGMSPEALQRWAEPFFTTKGEEGTGLGLPMVYGIVKRHGGTIEFQSAPGKGTTILIRLPVATPNANIETSVDTPAPTAAGLRVLVAEDEPSVRQLIQEYLSVDGHVTDVATDGFDAAEKFQAGQYDLVMTDRAMPRMSGDELARTVKHQAPDTPVIMVTGFGDLMNGADELPEGVDVVLSKPVSLAELRRAVKQVATAA